jgi:hypothetical protein
MRAVVLENERLRVTVLLDKGGDVVEFNYKPRDMDFVWLTPMGLRNPRDVAGGASDDVALFLDQYEGGWQEIFPSGGAPSVYHGTALAQHGEVAGLPWDAEIVADSAAEVAVRLEVRTRRLPFRVEKTLRLAAGSAALDVEERVTNESGMALDAMWGQHLVFGAPFFGPGGRVRLPDGIRVIPHETALNPEGRRVGPGGPWTWPTVPAADGGTLDLSVAPPPGTPSDIVYLTGFPEGWYEVTNGDLGLRVEWDAAVLPYLWMWQEFGGTTGYPWWGRAWTLGLEPFSSMPTNGLAEAVANGTAMKLEPHSTKALRLRMEVTRDEH